MSQASGLLPQNGALISGPLSFCLLCIPLSNPRVCWKFGIFDFLLMADGKCLNFFALICRRPTALHDRTRDSDDDDIQDRDYDVAALANNLSQAFRYSIYDNNDSDEVCNSLISLFWEVGVSVKVAVSNYLISIST